MVLKLTRGKRVFTTFIGLGGAVGWGSVLAASKIYNDPLPSLFADAFCLYLTYAGTDVALMGIKNEGELPITEFVLKNVKKIPYYFSELRYSIKKRIQSGFVNSSLAAYSKI